jgi:hypothetical protein
MYYRSSKVQFVSFTENFLGLTEEVLYNSFCKMGEYFSKLNKNKINLTISIKIRDLKSIQQVRLYNNLTQTTTFQLS